MKNIFLLLLLNVTGVMLLYGQQSIPNSVQQKAIASLIDQYSEAREKSDTGLLKKILTTDVDQLVYRGNACLTSMVPLTGRLQGSLCLR